MKYKYYTYYADTSCYRAHLSNFKYRYINLGRYSGMPTWSTPQTELSVWDNIVYVPDSHVLLAVGELPK